MNWTGIASIVGIGGWATWVCITYAAWPQLAVFWLAMGIMVYLSHKSKAGE